jgi:VWFA-related protein
MRVAGVCVVVGCAVFAQHPPAIRVDVDLVTVACSVMDKDGALVPKLTIDDFLLTDNGAPQQIKQLWLDVDLPLTIGLIVDVSGSQMGLIEKHKRTMSEFLKRVLGPQDQAFLVTVGPDVRLLTDLTNSVDELQRGVDAIDGRQRAGVQFGEPCRSGRRRFERGCGGTALWNGVWAASRLKMKKLQGRKALVIVSDGMDTGSKHKLGDTIEAAQGADTLVYAIKYVSPMVVISPGMALRAALSRGMRRLAEETGGEQFPSPHGGPGEIFAKIEQELRSQYVLAFSPSENGHDGKYHKLVVKMKQVDLRVRARKGYYATVGVQ